MGVGVYFEVLVLTLVCGTTRGGRAMYGLWPVTLSRTTVGRPSFLTGVAVLLLCHWSLVVVVFVFVLFVSSSVVSRQALFVCCWSFSYE